MAGIVDSCPRNLTETLIASARLGCGQDKYGNKQYLCLPNSEKTGLVEFCHDGVMWLLERGYCLETTGDQLSKTNCSHFLMGCPDTEVHINEMYRYPACLRISTEYQCYLADPICGNTTWDTTTKDKTEELVTQGFSTDNGVYNITETIIQTTTLADNNSADNNSALIGAIVGILVVAILLLLTVFIVLRRRKLRQEKGKAEVIEDENQVLLEPLPTMDIRQETKEIPKTVVNGDPADSEDPADNEDFVIQVHDCDNITESENFWIQNMRRRNLSHNVGDYKVWKTKISDLFSTLTDDEVSVFFCYLCSDSGPPDFTDTEWLDLLNGIRERVYHRYNPVTREEAQQTLERLKSRDYLWEDQNKITKDTKDETMYRIASIESDLPFWFSSYDTASVYLRSMIYNREPGEKCVSSSLIDHLLILRLQMNILTHVTMKDTNIYDEIQQILNVSNQILKESEDKRKEFLSDLRREGEAVHYRGRSQDSVDHVTWLWRYREYNRPDIVRSCIGLHPHNDIYIIDNKAYRKPSEHHKYSELDRSILYSLLLCDKYTSAVNEVAFKSILIKVRERYFQRISPSDDVDVTSLQDDVMETQNGEVTFISDVIRHDVMYAFVTECLVEDSDLEFFLTTASRDVISEYCRSWWYERSEGERCLYIPDRPEKMFVLFIDKLQLDIITHCTVSDGGIHDRISKRLKVPEEILKWDQKGRERYVQYAKRGGVQEVHHARGMIVGCAGAGKTTLLNRLLKRSMKEIKKIKSTKGLEVHEEILEICEEERTLKVKNSDRKSNKDRQEAKPDTMAQKTMSVFDFGGQCAYYACHQIYLTRRAFYVVVVNASKRLDQKVDKEVCDQEDTLFANWTYKDYFLFWMKSIHTYCHGHLNNDKDSDVIIILVATHWEKRVYKDKADFLDSLQRILPANSNLVQYIRKDRCFCTNLLKDKMNVLEQAIVNIAAEKKWSEKIPSEWILSDTFQKQKCRRVMNLEEIKSLFKDLEDEKQVHDLVNDMLRYYHDAGKVLHFDEDYLRSSVIIDVQWFVNAFKLIITDRHHVKGIVAERQDWEEFYKTGNLKDSLLSDIWKLEDKRLWDTIKDSTSSEIVNFVEDSRYLMHHKEELLLYLQRLGLISSEGQLHYVPSMNKRDFGEEQKEIINRSNSKSSVLVYLFDFLPYFFFYRLVVALMQIENWKVMASDGISCLYKDAAMFNHKNHNIAISVTPSTIQVQIFHSLPQTPMLHELTLSIREKVDSILQSITRSFHKSLAYKMGYLCDGDDNQIVGKEVAHNFIEESMLGSGSQMACPKHQVEGFHTINPDYLLKYWK